MAIKQCPDLAENLDQIPPGFLGDLPRREDLTPEPEPESARMELLPQPKTAGLYVQANGVGADIDDPVTAVK
jgi:hypothetical protein